jgi:hypothetical protein
VDTIYFILNQYASETIHYFVSGFPLTLGITFCKILAFMTREMRNVHNNSD